MDETGNDLLFTGMSNESAQDAAAHTPSPRSSAKSRQPFGSESDTSDDQFLVSDVWQDVSLLVIALAPDEAAARPGDGEVRVADGSVVR